METKYISTIKNEIRRRSLLWLPFIFLIILVLSFEIIPGIYVLINSFITNSGIGLSNYIKVFTSKFYLMSLTNGLTVSICSSLVGLIIGTCAAICLKSLKKDIAERLVSIVNMTSNFSGVPLAFAFIVLLGANGLITIFFKSKLGINLYSSGFDLYSWMGIILVYIYFQIPLAIMLMYPAVYAINDDIIEAASTLGASKFTIWTKIEIPTLLPSLAGSLCILLANSLGAYATAYALVGSNKNLVAITIANLVSNDIASDPSLASALSMVLGGILMIFVFVKIKLIKNID
ncbi:MULTISPECIES: ABC transporter permease [Clostridium]|uniref:2-aminoethylphosphonate transport system permease protein PhnU n=1 Tax=Clostridium coskatii TaxID=1705578 RepID=A0A170NMW9_9CLOT|nr:MULTISPECIES: ABC transporter permease subunit [Clostridium]OAA93228.1 putative 2-aminoethylphosphonate transport system permease protein PhnU [Clostridium coskatii]OBR95389.1 putative 2-aminoethylphosphonate transport system permease protein PhnU [Clostridium coskatii]QXE17921.1 ABC transporter permease [Clostridium sp. 001]